MWPHIHVAQITWWRISRIQIRSTLHKTQFEQEFGGDATYPQVSIGSKHIEQKETLHYMKEKD